MSDAPATPPDELRDWYRRYIDLLNSHRQVGMEEFIADEVVLNGQAVTRQDVLAVQTGDLEAVPDLFWDLREVVVEGSLLAARLVNTGTPRRRWLDVDATGSSFAIIELAAYRVEDGRFVEMTALHDATGLRLQVEGSSSGPSS